MKTTLSLILPLILTSATTASAALLAPGANIPAAATLDDPTLGVLVASTGPVAFSAATFSGTLVEEVRQESLLANPLGGLTFVWEVDSSASSLTDIERTTTFDFGGGWTVDATYFVDVIGDQAPLAFTRSGNSRVVGADFGLSAAALNPGQSSTLLVLRTNAPSYQPGIISVIDGGTDTVLAYAPIPEPAAAALLVIGGAVLLLSRRRRRKPQA